MNGNRLALLKSRLRLQVREAKQARPGSVERLHSLLKAARLEAALAAAK